MRRLLPVFAIAFVGASSIPLLVRGQQPAAGPQLNDDIIKGLALRSIGPALMTGRISDVAVDPRNRSVWYVGIGSGNVFKTTNRGQTWTPIFDSYGSYTIGCVALDPKNPDVVWVATGEKTSQRSASVGDGVYKSTDAGATFKHVGLRESEHIGAMLIDPRNTDVVYVAAQGPLWSAGGERGLFKTTDGGKSWKAVLQISPDTGVTEICMDPRNPEVIYAAAYQRRRSVGQLIGGGPEGGLYKTEDGGANWKKLSEGLPKGDIGRIGLAISPQQPDVVYAQVTAKGQETGFYRSADKGGSWTKMSNFNTGEPQYYGVIFACPHKFDRVYSVDTRMSVSDDGGKTFRGLNWPTHVDYHTLTFDPADEKHMLSGNDGGLYETYDGGRSFHHFTNLPISQFYRICVDSAKPFYNVYGGTQDNNTFGGPTRSANRIGVRTSEWIVTGGGDGFQPRVDPEDPNIVYATSQDGGMTRMDKRTGASVSIRPPGRGAGFGGPGGGGGGGGPPPGAPQPPSATMGLTGENAGEDKGAKIDEVTAGGPAATAGLRAGDVITKIGDKPIKTYQEVLDLIATARVGDKVKIEITRGTETQSVELTYVQRAPGSGGRGAGGGGGGRGGAGGPGGGRGRGDRFNWDTPYIVSPHSPTRLYVGTNRVWRSENRGDNWTVISPDLTRQLDAANIPIMGKVWPADAIGKNRSTTTLSVAASLDESPLKDGLILYGSDDGLIQITEDGGKNWRKLDKFPTVPEGTYVSDLCASRHDVNVFYATFENHQRGDYKPYVLKTTDLGKTWTPITSNLPDRHFVWSIVEDSVNKDLLFVGTELGLFVTVDGGKKWAQIRTGAPVIAFRDIAIQPQHNDLVCGTFGRGIYILDDYTPLRQLTPEALGKEGVMLPTRNAMLYNELGYVGRVDGDATHPNPPFGAMLTYYLRDKLEGEGNPKIVMTVTDAAGAKISEISGPATGGLHRVNWDLRAGNPPAPAGGGGRGAGGGGGGGGFGGRGGGGRALVRPGRYKVTLNKVVGDKTTPLGDPQEFDVVPVTIVP